MPARTKKATQRRKAAAALAQSAPKQAKGNARRQRKTVQKEKKQRKKKRRRERAVQRDDMALLAEYGLDAAPAQRRRSEVFGVRALSPPAVVATVTLVDPMDAAASEDEEGSDDGDESFLALPRTSAVAEEEAVASASTSASASSAAIRAMQMRGDASNAPPWAWCASPKLDASRRALLSPALSERYEGITVGLHAEILDFCALIQPTAAEFAERAKVVARLRALIADLWPGAELIVFGSTATGLCLPGSDIDCVVMGYPGCTLRGPDYAAEASAAAKAPAKADPALLRELGSELRRRDCISYLEVITSARIPIVKMKDKASGISVDICFGQASGLRTAKLTKRLIKRWAPLKPLLLTIKHFVYQRGMAETYRGGVGSYLVLLMVLAYLQFAQREANAAEDAAPLPPRPPRRRRERDDSDDDEGEEEGVPTQWRGLASLGELLLGFLRFYGTQLNYVEVGVSVRGDGSFFSKRARKGWFSHERPFLLAMENPDVVDADVGRNSFEMARVRRSFAHAFELLITVAHADEDKARELARLMKTCGSATLLGYIISADVGMHERRANLGEAAATTTTASAHSSASRV